MIAFQLGLRTELSAHVGGKLARGHRLGHCVRSARRRRRGCGCDCVLHSWRVLPVNYDSPKQIDLLLCERSDVVQLGFDVDLRSGDKAEQLQRTTCFPVGRCYPSVKKFVYALPGLPPRALFWWPVSHYDCPPFASSTHQALHFGRRRISLGTFATLRRTLMPEKSDFGGP